MINENSSRWLWYSGDFEIRQSLLQNFSREERAYDWPAYWYMDDCHRNVKFKRYYDLAEPTEFKVDAKGVGYVEINDQKFPFGQTLTCPAGHNKIRVFVGNTEGLPAVYLTGEIIKSDIGWVCSNFIEEHPAGWSTLYTKVDQDPNQVYHATEPVAYLNKKEIQGGVLFDFGRAIFGKLLIKELREGKPVTVCFGESETEALDEEMCYYKEISATTATSIRKRAFRYIFIPRIKAEDVEVSAVHEFIPLENKAAFRSDNPLLNQIWDVSVETFTLCSGLFFIDGIKRDRWIWSGDAYQSYFINQYLFFDEDINKRTMLALRGQNEIKQHMNTIVDYSILWLIGVENHYMMTNDVDFLQQIYPKMVIMMTYLQNQTNELGFIYGREKDWIFIDWSEMDKEGTLAAEQVLLLKAYHSMIVCGSILQKETTAYQAAYDQLYKNLLDYFWDDEKGAFIDSYESGKRHVTRHANIFAVLFDLVNPKQQHSILENVLLNDEITQITTPYFKFFEQDALCKLGETARVYEIILDYWGGMLAHDAVTFWEEYKPEETGADRYEMYGDPFGKSLCHAWGASPIYLLGRYFVGLVPTAPGYENFVVEPKLNNFDSLSCQFPIKDGLVTLNKTGDEVIIWTNKEGGEVHFNQQVFPLVKDEPLHLSMSLQPV
ncbi:family 78 glycoside hydrolase catalytic domain [Enterococcus pallens]|uniref:Alpha-L-rhamnosidase n=1 Tax=Enterococcus pallens ATCC BAA-351 TaxID=1158607 RepID=R2SGM6_9ENTE|nr:family 78 glycoside hydrolase catalytic domain [Enterococcus pallens]EOH94440.1 alpha-L-rhamnosidase [Enterococcus pallens ATCC BAA-351]EOU24319.1 alpha-L-rhamnosidase [Enterococcus pallens ATCC BAA-351]OJG81899.1 alpha-L-rhamnosidase [Enterococcus pallens]